MTSRLFWLFAFISPLLFCLTVLFLGRISPGYNYLSQTISQLVNYQYGCIQQLNFLQLAVSFVVAGMLLSRSTKTQKLRKIWKAVFFGSSVTLVVLTLFPTDQMGQFSVEKVTMVGLVHYSILLFFFLIAPIGIHVLAQVMKTDGRSIQYVRATRLIGYTACTLCYLFVLVFLTGTLTDFLGLFQRIIVLLCFIWYEMILWSIRPSTNYWAKCGN